MTVEAAGGVLWRSSGRGEVEVALVHRPKYDDWSLPKGKLDAGEHPVTGALREIEEETGFTAVPGRPLGTLDYRAFGAAKRVRYWACRAGPGRFAMSREVDELAWLDLPGAAARLRADRDRSVLRRFAADLRPTRALVVVRHASAGDRRSWRGQDRDRPLDATGQLQAEALAGLLRAYGVVAAASAEVRRCRDTLVPFSDATGVAVAVEPALTADAPCDQPAAGVDVLLGLADGAPGVACTQRELAADLVAGACTRLGRPVGPEQVGEPEKAGLVVLHVAGGLAGDPVGDPVGDPSPELVAWERLPPV